MPGLPRLTTLYCLLAAAGAAAPVLAATDTELVTAVCEQAAPRQADCRYHWHHSPTDPKVTARVGAQALPDPDLYANPTADGGTAILFIVDTSDPRRQPVIEAIRPQLATMVAKAAPHHRLGLAVFDSDLRVLAPLGASREEFLARAAALAATGKTTELYRNTEQALKLLAQNDAPRKALYVLSDGLAEDTAYGHGDAVALATRLVIPIYSIGYPRSVAQSVALQTLRKLSEATGGRFVAADALNYVLPDDFLSDPFQLADAGGSFRIDLGPAIDAGLASTQHLVLTFSSGAGKTEISTAVDLPPAAPLPALPPPAPAPQPTTEVPAVTPPAPATGPAAAPVPQPGRQLSPPPAPAAPSTIDSWIWYGTPAAFMLVVVVALVIYGRRMRARDSVPAVASVVPDNKPYAYLIQQNADQTRHVIAQTPWRIGRTQNNELCIPDHSVSRQHAEIHRRRDGKFEIVDLDSLNGVFINEKKIRTAELNEGDTVDIGDLTFKFTRFGDDIAAHEKTVMIRTQTP
jgi:hypothetical protein